jgi:hypothetical protein
LDQANSELTVFVTRGYIFRPGREKLWGSAEDAEPGVAPIDESLLQRTQVFCVEVQHLSAKRRA